MSQTITDTARYSFHVTWSPEDAEFIATCVEFPTHVAMNSASSGDQVTWKL